MTPAAPDQGAEQNRAAHTFLVKWCIVMGIVALVVGFLVLPHFVSSPVYP